MPRCLLDHANVFSHGVEDWDLAAIEYLSLQEPEDLDTVFLRFDKFGEERQELVVKANELVPNLGPGPELVFIGLEGCLTEIVVFEGVFDSL